MVDDYKVASQLMKRFPGKLLLVRYEDLVSWPFKTVQQMFQFLDMTVTSEVLEYLNRNSVTQLTRTGDNIAAMLRRHSLLGSRWVTQMEMEDVETVQEVCQSAMQLFGYKMIQDWTEKNIAFEPVLDFNMSH